MSRTITKQYEIFTLKEMLNNPETKQKLIDLSNILNMSDGEILDYILDRLSEDNAQAIYKDLKNEYDSETSK